MKAPITTTVDEDDVVPTGSRRIVLEPLHLTGYDGDGRPIVQDIQWKITRWQRFKAWVKSDDKWPGWYGERFGEEPTWRSDAVFYGLVILGALLFVAIVYLCLGGR